MRFGQITCIVPKFGTWLRIQGICTWILTWLHGFSSFFSLFSFPTLFLSNFPFLFSISQASCLPVLSKYRLFIFWVNLFIFWVKYIQTAMQTNLLIPFEKEFFTHFLCLLVSICKRKSKCHQEHFYSVFLEACFLWTFASWLFLNFISKVFLDSICHSYNSKCYY